MHIAVKSNRKCLPTGRAVTLEPRDEPLAAIMTPADDASTADATRELRDAFARAGIAGPHPLDADAIDLAYFGTGWDLVERDLRTGLLPDQLAAVTAILQQAGVHDAFVARDNLVNFKKVTLGIYHGAAMLGTDLRRMACFFRGPPATLPATGATPEAAPEVATAAAPEAATEAAPSRGFARTSRHSELCDALCETSGALGVVLDVRRLSKAACCVPRHPAGARGGLLAEPLPHALKAWALLQEARAFLSRSAAVDAAIADALSARLTAVARAVAALAAAQPGGERGEREGKSSGGASGGGDSGAVGGGSDGEGSSGGKGGEGGEGGEGGDALAAALCGVVGCGLPPSSAAYAFVRGVLIARGASKALRVTAELRGLVRLSALLLEASEAVAHALGEAGAALHARTAERAARLQRLADVAEARAVEVEGGPGNWAEERAAGAAEGTAGSAAGEDAEGEAAGEAAGEAQGEVTSEVAGEADAPPRWRGDPLIGATRAVAKHACTVRGLRAALDSASRWLLAIHDNPSQALLFGGGDGDEVRASSAFAPTGFDLATLFAPARRVAAAHADVLVARLARDGWPSWIVESAPQGKRAQRCASCSFAHTSTWVRAGTCLGCEARLRAAGRCPFAARAKSCSPLAWCPHDQRCAACDGWSCAACRFHQGDGSDVAALAAALRPAALLLDFDRTLCSTKGGGSPLRGNHTVDEELLALIAQLGPGRAAIVTRNPHVDDIATYLSARGLGHVPVHRVAPRASKAEVVLQGAAACCPKAEGACAADRALLAGEAADGAVLFVDDSIGEHLDARLIDAEQVVRFLFVRGVRSA